MSHLSESIDIREAVRLVTETKHFFTQEGSGFHIKEKGPANFVTDTDMEVESFLQEGLKAAYPDIQFMGEEQDNSSIDFSGSFWILDPVDGTTNLIHDYRHSAVSLALCSEGRVINGIIYCPFSDELFTAALGKGAFLNGAPIHVSRAAQLKDSLVSVGTTPYERQYADHTFEIMKQVFLHCQDIRRSGSAAMDLAFVACGRLEAFFEMNLKPWDYAAGMLLIQEAGGDVSTYSGDPVALDHPCHILATNRYVRDELSIYLSSR